jgi:hypothetical protein
MKGKYICKNYTEDNIAEQQRDKSILCNDFVFKAVVNNSNIYYFDDI